jgi:hypothetical protein
MAIKMHYFFFMKTWGIDVLKPVFEQGKHYYFICEYIVFKWLVLPEKLGVNWCANQLF